MIAHAFFDRLHRADLTANTGQVRRILPTFVEADGPALGLGSLCAIAAGPRGAERSVLAEIVGVNGDVVVLAPLEGGGDIQPGALVTACRDPGGAPVGDAFLGRAIDALGRPADGGPAIRGAERAALDAPAVPALQRASSTRQLETGVRAIDCLLTLAEGQRVGVFAASGVGKTSMITQLVGQVEADRCVICLIGERGREAEEIWRRGLSGEARDRSVMVVATSDETAAMRARSASYAVTLADHWRREGHHVLLIMDSVTRLAMALRELGLAAGEPPTIRAYTPSVFAALPRLVERCGALKTGGATTAIMTVLSETDDVDDPVCEVMKSILDGHIVLSRSLAEQGHFPAIDAPRSISRLASVLQNTEQRALAREVIASLALYESSRTLIESGVYTSGANADIDRALDMRPALLDFLKQDSAEHVSSGVAWRSLARILDEAV